MKKLLVQAKLKNMKEQRSLLAALFLFAFLLISNNVNAASHNHDANYPDTECSICLIKVLDDSVTSFAPNEPPAFNHNITVSFKAIHIAYRPTLGFSSRAPPRFFN